MAVSHLVNKIALFWQLSEGIKPCLLFKTYELSTKQYVCQRAA